MPSTDECSSGTIIRISQMVCGLIFIPSSTAWDYSSKHATMLMSSKIVHFRAVTMSWDKIESLFIHHIIITCCCTNQSTQPWPCVISVVVVVGEEVE